MPRRLGIPKVHFTVQTGEGLDRIPRSTLVGVGSDDDGRNRFDRLQAKPILPRDEVGDGPSEHSRDIADQLSVTSVDRDRVRVDGVLRFEIECDSRERRACRTLPPSLPSKS